MKRIGSSLLALTVLAGCGGKVLFNDDGSGHGGTGGTVSSTSTLVTTSDTGSTSTGMTFPCDTDADCPPLTPSYVCVHSDGKCGAGVKGVCTKQIILNCPLLPPVCFCNGTVAEACGTFDVSADPNLCSKSTFSCGKTACKTYVEYCLESDIGPSGGGPNLSCQPPPSQCSGGIAACSCINQGGDPDISCTDDMMGGVTVVPNTFGD